MEILIFAHHQRPATTPHSHPPTHQPLHYLRPALSTPPFRIPELRSRLHLLLVEVFLASPHTLLPSTSAIPRLATCTQLSRDRLHHDLPHLPSPSGTPSPATWPSPTTSAPTACSPTTSAPTPRSPTTWAPPTA